MQTSHPNEPQTVQAAPVVVQHNHWRPRPATKDEKRCCCTCTRASVCTFVVMMCIGGGALIGVGAGHLARQSHRYLMAKEYNEIVEATAKEYPSDGSPLGPSSPGYSVHNLTVTQPANTPGAAPSVASPGHDEVTPIDSAFHIDLYTSLVYTAYVRNWAADSFAKFTVNADDVFGDPFSESITRFIPPTQHQRLLVRCNVDACVDNCDHHMKCTAASLQSYCENTYGADAKYQGDDECRGKDSCGTCSYTAHLERVCVVLEDRMRKGFNHHLDSCYYPFHADSQVYGPNLHGLNNSVKVDFRSSADPFLAMQRITQGSMSFGEGGDARNDGLVQIFIGLALIFVPLVALCCYRSCCYQADRRRSVEDGVDGTRQEGDMTTATGVVMTSSTTPVVPAAQPRDFDQGF